MEKKTAELTIQLLSALVSNTGQIPEDEEVKKAVVLVERLLKTSPTSTKRNKRKKK